MTEDLQPYKKQLGKFDRRAKGWNGIGLLLSIAACSAALAPIYDGKNGAAATLAGMAGALIIAWRPTDKARQNSLAAATLRNAIANQEAGTAAWTLEKVGDAARRAAEIANAGKKRKKPKA